MPATITFSGTFTALATDLSSLKDSVDTAMMNLPAIAAADLITLPDEIRQMIRVFQDGWGAQLGSGVRLAYWPTVLLLRDFLNRYVQAGVPRVGA